MNIDYKKCRWFYTSSGKLVVGGKSAEQNEALVMEILAGRKDYVVMHTSSPGSPFSIIISDKVTEEDIKETAVFTACFSRAWREKKKKVKVDIFSMSKIVKAGGMKTGTFEVVGKSRSVEAELKLVLAKQHGIVRAVPLSAAEKKIFILTPGDKNKENTIKILAKRFNLDKNELMMALPSGGFRL